MKNEKIVNDEENEKKKNISTSMNNRDEKII